MYVYTHTHTHTHTHTNTHTGGRSTEPGSPNERSAEVGAKGGQGSTTYSSGVGGGRRLSDARERSRGERDADLEAMSAPKRCDICMYVYMIYIHIYVYTYI